MINCNIIALCAHSLLIICISRLISYMIITYLTRHSRFGLNHLTTHLQLAAQITTSCHNEVIMTNSLSRLLTRASNLQNAAPHQGSTLVVPKSISQGWKAGGTTSTGACGDKPESKHHSFFRHHLDFNALTAVSERPKKRSRTLKYYFSPEDTTENADRRQRQALRHEKISIPGVIKAVLWIAASICLALLIGNLN